MASHQQNSKTKEEYRDQTSTVPWLFAALDDEFDFAIDLAATSMSAKCGVYFTPETDSLKQDWFASVPPLSSATGWLNPPYSKILPWIEKAQQEQEKGFTTCFLVFADSSSEWWPQGRPCIIREITGYYYDHQYKTGKRKGTTGKRWASGRMEFVNAETGETMKDPLNKPCCLIIFPGLYRGPTLRESITKLSLMERGHARLAKLNNELTK